MTKLYKTTVNDIGMRSDGLGFFTQWGTPRTVDGTPMVQMTHGLFPADGWHATEQEAVNDAAQRIEVIGRRLLAQADRLRAEAAVKDPVTT
jgi:hypothetical protein